MSTLELVLGGTPPQFLDDSELTRAQNAQPATAGTVGKEIALVNQAAHAGRPFFSWVQGDLGTNLTATGHYPLVEILSCFRQVYMASNRGATTESGEIMGVTVADTHDAGFLTGQGFTVSIGTATTHAYWNYTTQVTTTFPDQATRLPFVSSWGYSTLPAEVLIGADTANFAQPVAGSIWQDPVNSIDSTKGSAVGSADVIAKGEIIATRGTGVEQLTSLINVFRDTWFHQRPQGGWSTALPGMTDVRTSTIRGVHFTTSTRSFRYIFDQTYGGGGTNFSTGSPAMTLPLFRSAGGIRTQVRVYVFVYAAMSGATDVGGIGVANKDSGGTMATIASGVTNSVAITGTTFQWYPPLDSTWHASTAPYFLAYTNSAFDRVALCAESSGATDHVIIGAFTFVVAPATS